jgi:hypothetical protein
VSRPAKKTIIIGLLSCAVLFLAAAYAWREPRLVQHAAGQTPWNSRAIESAFKGIQVREVDAAHASLVFLYDLENSATSDFQLTPGPGVVIMKRLKADGSLSSNTQARLVSGAFVPTNNRTRVELEVTDPFNWPAQRNAAAEQSFRDFVARETSGLQGFVIFDQNSRYEIDLPIDLAATPPAPSTSAPKAD